MVEPQQVVHALTDELGLGPVVRVEPVEQGWFNEVFRVELGDRSVFVRINRDREAFPRELAAYQRGAELLGYCQSALKDAQSQVDVLEKGVLRAFTPNNASDAP